MEKMNAQNLGYLQGENQFTDMTMEEKEQLFSMTDDEMDHHFLSRANSSELPFDIDFKAANEFDWTTKDVL
jgi:hypothetical protein